MRACNDIVLRRGEPGARRAPAAAGEAGVSVETTASAVKVGVMAELSFVIGKKSRSGKRAATAARNRGRG
jgi:hypothetical protein